MSPSTIDSTPTQSSTLPDTSSPNAGDTLTGHIESGGSDFVTTSIIDPTTSKVTFRLVGPSNADFDIYLKKGSNPTTENYDYKSKGTSSVEKIELLNPTSGTYNVLIKSYSGSGDYLLYVYYEYGRTTTVAAVSTTRTTLVPTRVSTAKTTSSPSISYIIGTYIWSNNNQNRVAIFKENGRYAESCMDSNGDTDYYVGTWAKNLTNSNSYTVQYSQGSTFEYAEQSTKKYTTIFICLDEYCLNIYEGEYPNQILTYQISESTS